MEPASTERTGRLLVVKLSSLGDLFHALPAVHALKEGLGVTVDWVTQNRYADLVACFSDVDRVIRFPRTSTFRRLPAFLAELRRESYDYVVDFQGLFKSGLVTRVARGGQRIGPSFSREGASLFYHAVAGPLARERHAVEEALDVLAFLDLPATEPVFPVAFPAYEVTGDHPRVAIAPCSRWRTKDWPMEHFAEVGRILREEAGASLYLVGGPGDREICDHVAGDLPGVINLCGRTTFPQMGGLLHAMDLAITVDTGPMHVAAAAGIPVLALFGATDPARTGPYGPRHRVITADGPDCRPCLSRRCRRHDLACLTGIDPRRVAATALEMLGASTG